MSNAKKKFKDTQVGQFLLNKIPHVAAKIAGDSVVGNVIEAIIGGSEMSEGDKAVALEKLRLERAEIDGVTRRWVADSSSQSWLARNVRPLTLTVLVCSYVGGWYMGLPTEDTASLLTWVLCGYFGARTADKIGVSLPNKK
jgi:hypothetical protein|tara:strand:- start:3146 stop:3568 length:423 start_codon:yes stop_codon:yes gene_type:complete